MVDVPVFSLDDAQLQARLTQALAVRAGVEELVARLVGEVDDRALATRAGASSTRALLQATHRMSRGQAAGMVAHANSVDDRTQVTRRAWAAGVISGEQAVVIGTAVSRLSPSVATATVHAAQSDLVGHAQRLTFPQLRHVAHHLVEVVDPDSADALLGEQLEAEEARALRATMFRGAAGVDGIARFSGRLPNAQYAMLTQALEACASPRRNAAQAPAAAGSPGRPGSGTSPVFDVDGDHSDAATGGPLTYPQRLGRALMELIEHLPVDRLPQHGVANAQIVVTVDADKLATGLGEATLDTGGARSVGQARRLACNAGLLPFVLAGPSRVLDLGMSQRLFTRPQRLALAHRDGGCIWPGCDRPPAWCEAHHTRPWSTCGPTDLSNGCLLCSFHHHLAHNGEWAVVMAADGTPEITPPARIDPFQRPLRHARFEPRPG